MRVPISPESLRIAEEERKKREARLNSSALYRLSTPSNFDIVVPENRKLIEARQQRILGQPGTFRSLLSSRGKFAFRG